MEIEGLPVGHGDWDELTEILMEPLLENDASDLDAEALFREDAENAGERVALIEAQLLADVDGDGVEERGGVELGDTEMVGEVLLDGEGEEMAESDIIVGEA